MRAFPGYGVGVLIGVLWAGPVWPAEPAVDGAALCARDRQQVERMARTRDAGIPEEQARQRYRELPAPPVLQAMWQTNLTLVYGRPNKTPTEVGAELEAHCLAALKK